MDDIPPIALKLAELRSARGKNGFGRQISAFLAPDNPKSGAISSDIGRIFIVRLADAGRIERRLPSPKKSGREELVCGGLGKEETLHLMGFPSNAFVHQ
jgi:hypothetical protein